jgi:3-deoxy-D-arabino-heptulosonate 7-phosphate (DAHP) synthase
LKRHYGASLRDWLGAAEYLMIEGNERIMLCERGLLRRTPIVPPHVFCLIFR